MLNQLADLAAAALEQHTAGLFFGVRHAGKIDSPEVQLRIQEGHPVGVALAMRAELANDTNLGFFVGVQPAKDQFLFCGEYVLRNNARAVAAEQHRLGLLGKNFALHVAAH